MLISLLIFVWKNNRKETIEYYVNQGEERKDEAIELMYQVIGKRANKHDHYKQN